MSDPYEAGEVEEESPRIGQFNRFVPRFISTLASPQTLYAEIADGAHWWQPWVWISLINIAAAQLFKPVYIHLMRLNPKDISEEQLQQTLEMTDKFWFVGLISTPVQMLVLCALIAGVSYVVVSVLAEESRYKKYLSLVMYCSIPVWLGALLGILVTRFKDINEIRSFQDAAMSFGPAILLGEESKMLYPFLSTLDLFSIWFYVLLGMGVMHVFKLTGRQAVIVVLPVYLVMVLTEFLRIQFGG